MSTKTVLERIKILVHRYRTVVPGNDDKLVDHIVKELNEYFLSESTPLGAEEITFTVSQIQGIINKVASKIWKPTFTDFLQNLEEYASQSPGGKEDQDTQENHIAEPGKMVQEAAEKEAVNFLKWAVSNRWNYDFNKRKWVAAWNNYQECTAEELYKEFAGATFATQPGEVERLRCSPNPDNDNMR